MSRPLQLSPDRLFPSDPGQRDIARRLYAEVASLPIISPHGHTDPSWFADNAPFGNAAELLLHPDHYLFRMLYSQGISLDALGIGNRDADPRESWRLFARNYRLFRGTPSRMWMDWVFAEVFGFDVQFSAETSDLYYDRITEALTSGERIDALQFGDAATRGRAGRRAGGEQGQRNSEQQGTHRQCHPVGREARRVTDPARRTAWTHRIHCRHGETFPEPAQRPR